MFAFTGEKPKLAAPAPLIDEDETEDADELPTLPFGMGNRHVHDIVGKHWLVVVS